MVVLILSHEFQHSRQPRNEWSKVKRDERWSLWRKTSKGFRTNRNPKGNFSALPMNELVWFTGMRKKVLEVPDKEGKEISQSSPVLQVGPRQTLPSALCGMGIGQVKEPGQRCRCHLWLPTVPAASFSGPNWAKSPILMDHRLRL